MTNKRFKWYQKEIQRLRELDTQTTNKVRATYTIKKNKNENNK
tara:strand:+ start:1137 stop:1265 length:129 start_codon:yes stop_codon:yes gene_type:complete